MPMPMDNAIATVILKILLRICSRRGPVISRKNVTTVSKGPEMMLDPMARCKTYHRTKMAKDPNRLLL